MKLSILCIVLLCSVIYAQQTREEVLHYIEVELYDELLNISLSDTILDIINAAIAEDYKSFEKTMDNIDSLKNNDKFQSAIEYAATDKEIRAALRKTALRALKRKWRDLFR